MQHASDTDEIVPCWLCGDPADSAEHIFKARDLRRIFDRDGYARDGLPFHFHSEGHNRIRGPKADRMKYPKLMCRHCNNDRTSNFDRAYDRLSDWFMHHQANYTLSHVDFRAAFGADFETSIDAFRRHCAKALGCRLLASGYTLPPHFPNPVYDADIEGLQLSICRAQPLRDVENYRRDMMERVLGKGDLYANLSRSHLEATGENFVKNAIWWENVGHFQISYWFFIETNPRFGVPIDGSPLYPLIEYDLGLAQMNEEMFAWLSH